MSLLKVNVARYLHLSQQRLFSLNIVKHKSFRKWYRDFWIPQPINNPPYAHIAQIGDPVLRSKASPVPEELIKSKEVALLIERMVKVMRKYSCAGISAPQIGVSLRIIAIEFHDSLRDEYSDAVYKARKMSTLPLTVLINPTMTVSNYEKHKYPEGCMSVRGYSGEVERYAGVILTGCDALGMEKRIELNGWNARIAQHEMDHLDGELYTDHMDLSTFICTCWEVVNRKCGRVEIPFYK